jgi:hypothetical protein
MLKYLPMICLFTTAAFAAPCPNECPNPEALEKLTKAALEESLEKQYENLEADVGISYTCDAEVNYKRETSCIYSVKGQDIIELIVPAKLKE